MSKEEQRRGSLNRRVEVIQEMQEFMAMQANESSQHRRDRHKFKDPDRQMSPVAYSDYPREYNDIPNNAHIQPMIDSREYNDRSNNAFSNRSNNAYRPRKDRIDDNAFSPLNNNRQLNENSHSLKNDIENSQSTANSTA